MSQSKPIKAQVDELNRLFKDIKRKLNDLIKCQEDTVVSFQTTADSIDKRYTRGSILISVGTVAVGSVALPTLSLSVIALLTLFGFGAGEAWNFFGEYKERRNLKKNLDKCAREEEALKKLQDTWESLMKELGVDNILMVNTKAKTFTPHSQQFPFSDTVQSRFIRPFFTFLNSVNRMKNSFLPFLIWSGARLKDISVLVDNVIRMITKISEQEDVTSMAQTFNNWIEDDNENLLTIMNNVTERMKEVSEHDGVKKEFQPFLIEIGVAVENISGFLQNLPTPEGDKLRHTARVVEQNVIPENKQLQDILRRNPENLYSTEGLHLAIKKSNVLSLSLKFSEEMDYVNFALSFDGLPLFHLKPEGKRRTIGPFDDSTDVIIIQEQNICQDEDKERALAMVNDLLDLKTDVTRDVDQFEDWLESVSGKDDKVFYRNLRKALRKMKQMNATREISIGKDGNQEAK